ncbi:hypothetical protein RB201_36270 [Streptomyces sp. S1A(2023)]
MSQQIPSATTQAVDPADFVAELHAEGNMPQNSGGVPGRAGLRLPRHPHLPAAVRLTAP